MRLCWKLAPTLKRRKSGAKRWRENLLRKAASVWDLPGGHLMRSFPLLFLYPSTILVCSSGSGLSQSPWLFHGRHYSHYKVWGCLFSCVFYHTNKALSIVLAFSFTLTALESFSSRASAFRTGNYFKSSTTVAVNEEAIEMLCCWCCYSSLASVINLNVTRAINLTHSFGSIKQYNKTFNNARTPSDTYM